jgi:hypothetical protein
MTGISRKHLYAIILAGIASADVAGGADAADPSDRERKNRVSPFAPRSDEPNQWEVPSRRFCGTELFP